MIGLYKINNISGIGGTTPQGEGIELLGEIEGWNIVEIPDERVSEFQEFNIIPINETFKEKLNAPQFEGAYNKFDLEIGGKGDHMRIEMNPGVTNEEGEVLTSPDEEDTESKKVYTAEDVKGYKELQSFVRKLNKKTLLRENIRGTVKDLEDDIADTKILIQTAMYYFSQEAKSRTNTSKQMLEFANKVLDDNTNMRIDLNNGIEKIKSIFEEENKITELVNSYKNAQ